MSNRKECQTSQMVAYLHCPMPFMDDKSINMPCLFRGISRQLSDADGESLVTRRMDTRRSTDTTIDQWMKTHTVQDMEDLVAELAAHGEDVKDMAKVVHDLEEMIEEEQEWEQEHAVKGKNEAQA